MERKEQTLDDLWNLVKNNESAKDDLIVTPPAIEAVPIRVAEPEGESFVPTVDQMDDFRIRLGEGNKLLPVRQNAQRQLGQFLHIPANYWDFLRANDPVLLTTNINRRAKKETKKRMVRTLNGEIRAFLSDSYHPRDNFDLLTKGVLPAITQEAAAKYNVISCNVDPDRLFLKFVNAEVKFDLSGRSHHFHKADVLYGGLVVSNNEIGNGSIGIEPFFFNEWCDNTAIMKIAFRKYHVGRKWKTEADVEALISDATREKEDDAFFAAVGDVIRTAFDQLQFEEMAEAWIAAKNDEVPKEAKVEAVVEKIAKRASITEVETESIMESLIRNSSHNGINRYAIANAITDTAKNADTYDRAVELERTGGRLIELLPNEWKELVAVPA